MAMAAMTADWRDTFTRWSKPASDNEEAMAERAANMIRTAVRGHAAFAGRNIDVYGTGSYRNNTNVRSESDIDVAVVCRDSVFYELPPSLAPATVGFNGPAPYGFEAFRADLEAALRAKFGSATVAADKTFNVPENTYRLEADVTPFFEFQRYTGGRDANLRWVFDEGVKSVSRRGETFINWHDDHYRQGVARNDQTRLRFKRVARILKNVKCDMAERGSEDARAAVAKVPSFLVECLVFNAPDTCFNLDANAYVADVKAVISHLWNATKPDGTWRALSEVSRRKTLFLDGQAWTREMANTFLLRAWQHLGF